MALKYTAWRCVGLMMFLVLTGCATGPDAHPQDPLEPWNRGVYKFNDVIDTNVLKPVATTYTNVTPEPVRRGVGNFFNNIRDVWSSANAALQLRPQEAVENLFRVGVNTFLGLGGVLDVATELGIPRTRLDFGQTLGRWGVPSGPYLVLPLLGPSSVRDATGTGVQFRVNEYTAFDDSSLQTSLTVLEVVDTRAGLLRAGAMLNEAAIDKYSFMRDFYLQRRQNQIDDLIDQGIGVRDSAPPASNE
ncbi:MAG: VacJ family lipoprotein [Hydrogenophaga sp.]